MFVARCPKCATELDVDDTDRGHRVSCPDCGTRFMAEEAPARPTPAKRAPAARRWTDGSDYVNDTVIPPRHWLDREDDRGPDPLRIVRRQLAWPANGLIWTGWIGFLLMIVGGFLTAVYGYLDLNNPYRYGNGPVYRLVLGAIAATLGSVFYVMIASGGTQMKRVRNRRQATGTAVMAVLTLLFCTPIFPVAWAGAGFGVWALVVLNRPEVIEAFKRRESKG